jgi:hypothetical protein
MNIFLSTACAMLLVAAAGVAAPPTPSPEPLGLDPVRLARIDGLVAEALAAGEMSGCVVCIGRRASAGSRPTATGRSSRAASR